MKKKILAAMIVLTVLSVFWGLHRIKGERIDRAENFYSQSGFSSSEIKNHLKGINFDKPVAVIPAEQGKVYWQYQNHDSGQGNYYASPGTRSNELGISSTGRELRCYEVSSADLALLKSTAADIEDNWSTGSTEAAKGGALQYFSACKKCFTEVNCQ